MSELEPERFLPLRRGGFGEPYLYFRETGSTQDVLREGDHPHGAVALAEHQTAGRGRSGRRWEDAPASTLLFSVLIQPPAGAALQELSLVAGLAVATAIEHTAMIPALVKWPNDVLVDGGKVAGILLEASGTRVVCGIGINVNQEPSVLPPTPRFPAVSLRVAAGHPFDRALVLVEVLAELERRYGQWLETGLAGLVDDLGRRNALNGRRVLVGGSRHGTADAIAPDGRLTVVLDDGETTLVGSGEVEIV